MSDNTNLANEIPEKESFINTVFDFSDESKAEYLNIMQYSVMMIVPILILNKLVGYVMPSIDDEKGSIELTIEVVIQTLLLFIGILIINKAVRYFPTYSGVKYEKMSMLSIVPVFLVIMLSLQTRLGQKSAIVVDRAIDIVNEKVGIDMTSVKSDVSVAAKPKQVSKPSVPQVPIMAPTRTQNPTGAQSLVSNVNVPHNQSLSDPSHGQYSGPDFNSMYSGPDMSYPGAQSPGQGFSGDLLSDGNGNEPMAANSVLGGFGSGF